MKKPILILLFALFTIASFAQSSLTDQLNLYLSQWQKGESVADIKKQLLQSDQEDVLSEIERFAADTNVNKRYAMYRLLGDVSISFDKPKSRTRAIKQLVFGTNDRDGGIAGANLKALTFFNANDFDAEAKYILTEKAKTPDSHYKLLVQLCGWLKTTDLIYDFRQKIDQKEGTSIQERWAMRLALSRMGEPDMTEYCLNRLKKAKINDDVVYEFIPDLIYTRQKPIFDHLLTLIESDEKNCTTSNPDSDEKIICAYRIIEQIAPYIENFPAKVDVSGELITNDYAKLLVEVRTWITQNRESYKIVDTAF
jgi:hypothetical protein